MRTLRYFNFVKRKGRYLDLGNVNVSYYSPLLWNQRAAIIQYIRYPNFDQESRKHIEDIAIACARDALDKGLLGVRHDMLCISINNREYETFKFGWSLDGNSGSSIFVNPIKTSDKLKSWVSDKLKFWIEK